MAEIQPSKPYTTVDGVAENIRRREIVPSFEQDMVEPRLVPINIGTRKQVFVDQSFIAAGYGVGWMNSAKPIMMPRGIKLEVHSPIVSNEPIFAMPGQTFGGGSLLCENGKLKLYYGGMRLLQGEEADFSVKLHYAESKNGRSWTLPSLGIVESEGSSDNNIIFMQDLARHQYPPRGATVFRDVSAAPEERYKLVYCWEYREGTSIYRPAVPPIAGCCWWSRGGQHITKPITPRASATARTQARISH